MHAVARTLVLSFGRGTGSAHYWALEGTKGDEHMVLAHEDFHLITEKANSKIIGQLIKLLDFEKSLDTETQEVQ